jgi:hypothetical protein
MRPPPPSMAWPGPSSSSCGHPPRGARPLPRPPVGGRGGSSKGKGRDLGPPPPVNCATHPPPPGKGSYAQTTRFDGGVSRSSVDGIVRLAKAFPELPTKRLEVMQRAAGPPHKAPRASAMVHGPSRRQVLVTIRPAQGTPNPEHLLKTIRTQLALHHSSLVVELAVVSRDGYSVVMSTVASDSDLLQVRGVARMCHLDAEHVDVALPTSTSYLKLVDIPFFTVGDARITLDGVMAQIGKSGFASLVVLQTPARVVCDSPKSDTCTVYLNVADSVSGARAKGLVRKTVQFGQYASYFRAARANPGSPLCSCCWRWGHPSSACRTPQLRCPICLGPHHKDHHWVLFFFFFFLIQQFITRCSIAVRGKPYKTKYSLRVYTCKIGREITALTSPFRAVMSPARAKRGQENDKEHWALRRLPKPALAPDGRHPQHAQSTPKDVPSRSRTRV